MTRAEALEHPELLICHPEKETMDNLCSSFGNRGNIMTVVGSNGLTKAWFVDVSESGRLLEFQVSDDERHGPAALNKLDREKFVPLRNLNPDSKEAQPDDAEQPDMKDTLQGRPPDAGRKCQEVIVNALTAMQTAYDTIQKVRDELRERMQKADLQKGDLLHYAEFYSLNAKDGYKVYRELHQVLQVRRGLKDAQATVDLVSDIFSRWSRADYEKALRNIDGLNRRVYGLRVPEEFNLPIPEDKPKHKLSAHPPVSN